MTVRRGDQNAPRIAGSGRLVAYLGGNRGITSFDITDRRRAGSAQELFKSGRFTYGAVSLLIGPADPISIYGEDVVASHFLKRLPDWVEDNRYLSFSRSFQCIAQPRLSFNLENIRMSDEA